MEENKTSTTTVNAVYRYYPKDNNKRRPAFFSKELCFRSFLQAWLRLGSARGRLVFLSDTERLEGPVLSLAEEHCDAIRYLGGKGNCASYIQSVRLAEEFSGDELVYLAEDDYLYREEAFVGLCHAATDIAEATYFTLYDHPDRYTRDDDAKFRKKRLYLAHDHHWRSVESTCMSFAARSSTIRADRAIHFFAARRGPTPNDRRMWRLIQGIGPFAVKLPKRLLVCPVPAFATHMEAEFLAPAVDWAEVAGTVDTGRLGKRK